MVSQTSSKTARRPSGVVVETSGASRTAAAANGCSRVTGKGKRENEARSSTAQVEVESNRSRLLRITLSPLPLHHGPFPFGGVALLLRLAEVIAQQDANGNC